MASRHAILRTIFRTASVVVLAALTSIWALSGWWRMIAWFNVWGVHASCTFEAGVLTTTQREFAVRPSYEVEKRGRLFKDKEFDGFHHSGNFPLGQGPEHNRWRWWGGSQAAPGSATTRGMTLPMWPLAVLVVVPLLPPTHRAIRKTFRRRLGLCRDCGYDRSGLPRTDPCPECGRLLNPVRPSPKGADQ
jgi:hypothetical protein